MCYKKVVRRSRVSVKILLLGVISLMYYGNLDATIYTFRPNAVGDETLIQYTHPILATHWQMVDDVTPDEEDTYVCESWGNSGRDLYNIANHTAESGTIGSVVVFARVKSTSTGNYLKIRIKTGGTIYESPDKSVTTSYANYSHTWTEKPGGGAWTWADIDVLQAGVHILAPGGASGSTHCTQVYVEVHIAILPLPPTNCSATDDLCGSIEISWTDNSDNETGFKVYCVDSGQIGTTGENDTTYVHKPSTGTYEYYVTAYNAFGESDTSNHCYGTSMPTGVTVTIPDGGEIWVGGSSHQVTWSAPGTGFDSYSLFYSKRGIDAVDYSLSSSHPTDPDYDNTWIISDPEAEKMKVHFSKLELTGTAVNGDIYIYDKADNEIIHYTFADDGLDIWTPEVPGDTVKVRFTIPFSFWGNVYGFDIDKYVASPKWHTITTGVSPSATSYNWTLPMINCSTCKVKIQMLDASLNVLEEDASNDYFTIQTCPRIISPNGSEEWASGTPRDILWSLGSADHYKLLYSTNEGFSYSYIIADNILATDTSYSWVPPAINSSKVRVKIQALDASGGLLEEDASDNNFAIQLYPTVTYPNGGEELGKGLTYAITWETVGAGFDSYRILYLLAPPADTITHSVSSPHPYPADYNNSWTISHPGADKMKVHFSKLETEEDFDFVYLYDKNDNKRATYTGNLGAFWSAEISGDMVRVQLVSDENENAHGFDIDKYATLNELDAVATGINPDSSLWNWTLPDVSSTTCKVKVQILNSSSDVISEDESNDYFTITLVGAEELAPLPKVYSLSLPYPNPAIGKTVISYQLPAKTVVSLRIYDVGGRLAKTLVDGEREPGYYQVAWDMRDNAGKQLSGGIYFYRLFAESRGETSEFTATKKLIIVR